MYFTIFVSSLYVFSPSRVCIQSESYLYLFLTCVMWPVSKPARCVGPFPVRSLKPESQTGTGKDHSYGDMVRKMDGAPNWLTGSRRNRCCHFQHSVEKGFASSDLAGEHMRKRPLVSAPLTVLKSQMS